MWRPARGSMTCAGSRPGWRRLTWPRNWPASPRSTAPTARDRRLDGSIHVGLDLTLWGPGVRPGPLSWSARQSDAPGEKTSSERRPAMSACVGIDVHRKRSQVAVIDAGGEVLANRNVPNGVETILGVIGGLPPGTPVAFEAAFGWGWLVELLEDYGSGPHLVHPLRCKAIASARLKNDKGRCGDLGAAAARGPAA